MDGVIEGNYPGKIHYVGSLAEGKLTLYRVQRAFLSLLKSLGTPAFIPKFC